MADVLLALGGLSLICYLMRQAALSEQVSMDWIFLTAVATAAVTTNDRALFRRFKPPEIYGIAGLVEAVSAQGIAVAMTALLIGAPFSFLAYSHQAPPGIWACFFLGQTLAASIGMATGNLLAAEKDTVLLQLEGVLLAAGVTYFTLWQASRLEIVISLFTVSALIPSFLLIAYHAELLRSRSYGHL